MLDRFFRRNVYWLLLVTVLIGALVYQSTRPPQVVPASQIIGPDQLEVLFRPVAGEFHQVSLRNVLAALSREVGQDITLGAPRFILPNPEMPVDLVMHDPIPLWQALDRLCQQASEPPNASELTYVVVGSTVLLTTRTYTTTVVYDVRDLMPHGSENFPYDTLTTLMRDIEDIGPDTWRTRGGDIGTVVAYRGRLIIVHTARAHCQIQALLAELRKGQRKI